MMKLTHITKKSFNLIEITLAVAIIAFGASSIMVLFPIGINANKEAVAENNIQNVSEYLFSVIETYTRYDWQESVTTNVISKIPTKDAIIDTDDLKDSDKYTWNSFDGTAGQTTSLYVANGVLGLFKYEQTTEVEDASIVEFSAIIRVWREDVYITNPYALNPVDIYNSGEEAPTASTALETYEINSSAVESGIKYFMEISYPAEIPYSSRKIVTFQKEMVNE